MNIRDEELVQRYFEREMNSAEEQNFLIDVAARDEMRLAFRSNLELIKAVGRDREIASSTALVRERTLAALGLSAAMIPAATEDAEAAPLATRIASGTKSFFTKPITALLGGILVGSIGVYTLTNNTPTQNVAPAKIEVVSPAVTAPQVEESVPQAVSSEQTVPVTQKEISKPQTNRASNTSAVVHKPQADKMPVVTKQKPGEIIFNKPVITKPGEQPAKK